MLSLVRGDKSVSCAAQMLEFIETLQPPPKGIEVATKSVKLCVWIGHAKLPCFHIGWEPIYGRKHVPNADRTVRVYISLLQCMHPVGGNRSRSLSSGLYLGIKYDLLVPSPCQWKFGSAWHLVRSDPSLDL